MARLARNVLLLALPFALIAAAVAAIDPFAYFAWNAHRDDPAKRDIAYRLLPPLSKLAAYRNAPAPNLLLGDSRMASLDAARIDSLTGTRVANLGFGGGSLDEAMRTFWYADTLVRLESVTFGVNLDLYNESNAKDRVTGVEKILANPLLYVFDRIVLRAAVYDVQRALSGRQPVIGVPPMDKQRFWKYQLDVTARIAFESYRYPASYRERLEAIAAHCRARGIRLRFVIFPEHADLAAVSARYGLDQAGQRMATDLAAIGDTYDLRHAVDITDRDQYIDPYHFGPAIGTWIVDRVWGAPAAGARAAQ